MFKKNDFKNHSISSASIVEDEKGSKDSYISRDLNKKAKNSRKRRQKEKCKNLKKCFGFCDFLSTSWRTFKEFSADTSIHGIKYLTDKQRHWTEKLFWAIALILSICACSFLIYITLQKCMSAPLLLSFSPKPINIWEIPFCSITICPNGAVTPLNENYNMNKSQDEKINALKEFPGKIEERITNVKWRNDEKSSTELFTEVLTQDGYCYTFNMMNYKDLFHDNVKFEGFENLKNATTVPLTKWSLETGYEERSPFLYPFRVSGSGENGGLKFEIWRKIDEAKASTSITKGFKLVIHLPCEIPQFDKQYYRIPLEKSATLIVRPSMTVADELKGYSVNVRQCYYEGERILELFKNYTRANCLVECLTNHIRKNCGCVHFSMPRLPSDRICDQTQEKCFEEGKRNLSFQIMNASLYTSKSYDDRGEIACSCLPECTSLKYEGEISQDDIRFFNRSQRVNDAFRSVITVLFKDDDFLYTRRSELYTVTEFIANFGGLLGLFLGISILSIVEIIYFIAFRQLNEDDDDNPSRSDSSGSAKTHDSDENENEHDDDNLSNSKY